MRPLLCSLLCLSGAVFSASAGESPSPTPPEVRGADAEWAEISRKFVCPDWFADAKLGVWVHWGAQAAPEAGGGWYARHMYMPDVGAETWGKTAYPTHVARYGHPSEAGFKEVIHSWKAERLDAAAVVAYAKGLGARYFVAMANHHDHFDNFDSSHHPWNSVKVGPRRDIVGEFAAATRRAGLPFGVSSHDDRFLSWWLPAFGADKTGPKAGVPYDGRLTKADGKGKWWEGLDPADLYGLPPERRTPAWVRSVKENWLLRHNELVTKYRPDMLWFDGHGFPYGDYGRENVRTLYRLGRAGGGGSRVLACAKVPGERAVIRDIELGVAEEISETPWQGTVTCGSWFYNAGRASRHDARTLVETLADMASKNGNMLLNIELRADGSLPEAHRPILDAFGRWVAVNGEALHGSRPWRVFGDHSSGTGRGSAPHAVIGETDLAAVKKRAPDFNGRTVDSPRYSPDTVRYTTRAGKVYAWVLAPEAGPVRLPALGAKSPHAPGVVSAVRLLGATDPVVFRRDDAALEIVVPERRPTPLAAVFEITFAP